MTPEALFATTKIELGGKVDWQAPVHEKGPGVYLISVVDPAAVKVEALAEIDRPKWKPDQQIVYIGRSIRLSRRLRQFYKHRYGDKSPHAGGQAILKISEPLHIHWAKVEDYPEAEERLIDCFEAQTGRKPFGNRCKAAQTKKSQEALP